MLEALLRTPGISTTRHSCSGNPRTASGLVAKALLRNILNPRLTVFFLAFLPQSVTPDAERSLLQLLLLSAIFMA